MRSIRRILQRSQLLFFVVWIGLVIAASAWVISTPLGGSPDEPAHIIKAAAVAHGELLGEPSDEPAVRWVLVPSGLAQASSWPCYAFNPEVSANCLGSVGDGSDLVRAKTSAGLYNPVYYAIVGWPSLLTGDASLAVMSMRLIGAVLSTLFLTVTFMALRAIAPRRVVVAGFAAIATPMVLFLSAAVNPNAFEVATGAALLSSLLVLLGRRPVARRWPWLAVIAVSGVLLAQARGLSPLWMAVIVLIALVATPWDYVVRELRRWSVIATVMVVGLGAVGAAAWTFSTGTLGSMGSFPGATDSPSRAFVNMLTRAFDPGLIGVFGWLDTPAPTFVYALWSFLALAIVAAALVVGSGRLRAAVIVALAAVVLGPAVVQAASIRSSGYIWQGRYTLVAYVAMLVIATVTITRSTNSSSASIERSWVRRATAIGFVVVLIGQLWALFGAVQRYQGVVSTIDVVLHPRWLPPGGVLLDMLVLAIGLSILGLAAIWSVPPDNEYVEPAEQSHRVEATRS